MENFVIFKNESKILCNPNEKIKDIYQRFISQIGLDVSRIDFLYKGNKINQELTFQEIANEEDKKNKGINIVVNGENNNEIKVKEIICPICNENILIKIKNYKINLYDCKNHHKKDNIPFEKISQFLNIDLSKIICQNCKVDAKKLNTNINEFFTCHKCKINICQKCKSLHDKNHKLYSYESKNNMCTIHSMYYAKYCKECKLNLCMKCERDHRNHDCIYFADILPNNEDEIKNEMKELK